MCLFQAFDVLGDMEEEEEEEEEEEGEEEEEEEKEAEDEEEEACRVRMKTPLAPWAEPSPWRTDPWLRLHRGRRGVFTLAGPNTGLDRDKQPPRLSRGPRTHRGSLGRHGFSIRPRHM
ncbi:hypothetical protein EYF80_031897 [Liparis tanakae]|uniref:Uncharacterized protein n=1 Tax=Liparis tanakae TaxID=230148 RepID=A0A4Z2GWD8_9TELE|nr:hypothetical protein EYF80_031897 [Liparis tanakae]